MVNRGFTVAVEPPPILQGHRKLSGSAVGERWGKKEGEKEEGKKREKREGERGRKREKREGERG